MLMGLCLALCVFLGCQSPSPSPDPWPVTPDYPPLPQDDTERWGVGTVVGPFVTDPYTYNLTSNEAYTVWMKSESTNTNPTVWYFMQRDPNQFSPTE